MFGFCVLNGIFFILSVGICMCSGLKVNMEARYQPNLSKLLEFSATDDVSGFISEVEEKGCDVNEMSYWYGRRVGSRKMGFEERTPILIAAIMEASRF